MVARQVHLLKARGITTMATTLVQERELQRGIETEQAQITALHEEIAAQQAEPKRIADRRERLAADAQDARQAMGAQRWADRGQDDEQEEP
jgi:hypothetical protein